MTYQQINEFWAEFKKPCPFCGSKELTGLLGVPDMEGTPANVMCIPCGAIGPWVYIPTSQADKYGKGEIPSEAMQRWNNRAYGRPSDDYCW